MTRISNPFQIDRQTGLARKAVSGVLTLMLVSLAGCAPPPVRVADSGKKIAHYEPHTREPFKTVEIDGVEFKQSRDPQGEFGGTYNSTGLGGGPKTFNPLVSKDASSSTVAGLMFSGLADMDAYTGEMTPHLAKTIEILPDKRTYKITLRKGLLWSDGVPITADDVVFTWNDIIKPGLGNPSNRDVIMIDGKLPEVTKLDNLTVKIVTPTPFAPFQQNLSNAILPKHAVEKVIRNNPQAFDSFWGVSAKPKTFVVNGPFMLDEYISGQRVVLKRNPKYFMVDPNGKRLPYLDRYTINFVQDQNAEMLEFQQGKIDILGVPGKDVYYVKNLNSKSSTVPDFKMLDLGPASGTSFLVFNLNPRNNRQGQPYVNPKQSAWFRDLNFRKAVDYAIRRDQIVQNILMGVGEPLFTAESLASVFLNPDLAKGHPADLEKSRGYLRASGFQWNAEDQLLDKHGNRVEFELITNAGNLERESVGVAIKNDLSKLGIKVNFKPIDFNVLVGKMDSAEWQAVMLGLTGSPTEPHGGKNVWESSGGLHLFNQRNPKTDGPGGFLEPWERELDKLFNLGATTLEFEQRKKIYYQYQQVVADNLPLIYLYSPKSIIAYRTRLQNFDPTPLGTLHNLESIWVKSE